MKRTMREHKSGGTSGLLGLRAVVVPDDGSFFAQGLDVDYFASGQTKEEAEKNFEDGLEKLVQLHLQKHGTVERLRQPAPEQVKQEYANMTFANMDSHPLQGMAAKYLYFPKVVYWVA